MRPFEKSFAILEAADDSKAVLVRFSEPVEAKDRHGHILTRCARHDAPEPWQEGEDELGRMEPARWIMEERLLIALTPEELVAAIDRARGAFEKGRELFRKGELSDWGVAYLPSLRGGPA